MKKQEFKELADEAWRNVAGFSSCHSILKDEKVKEIIALGDEAVPLILKYYKTDVSILWSLILTEITKADLIGEGFYKKEYDGKVRKIRKAWMKWGKSKKYI